MRWVLFGARALAVCAAATAALGQARATDVQISPAVAEVISGEERQLVVHSTKVSLQRTAVWTSSDPNIVSIDDRGVAQGKALQGEAQIVVRVKDPLGGPDLEARTTIRSLGNASYVRFQAPVSWQQPHAYVYSARGQEPFGKWPGQKLEADPRWGGNWYRASLPRAEFAAEPMRIIFNSNAGEQTRDFALPARQPDALWFAEDGQRNPPGRALPSDRGTQIQTAGAKLGFLSTDGGGAPESNLSGQLFHAGQVLTLTARPAAPGERFSHFEGSGSRYVLDTERSETLLLVESGVSFTVFAVYEPLRDDFSSARSTYQANCSVCHGPDGRGRPPLTDIKEKYSQEEIAKIISTRMPPQSPGSCSGACADELARFLMAGAYSTPEGTCSAAGVPPAAELSPRDLRLLTRSEYLQTIQTLIPGLSAQTLRELDGILPEDFAVDGFRTDSTSRSTPARIEGFFTAAQRISNDVNDWQQLAPQCRSDVRCAISDFGMRAFRRSLTGSEAQEHKSLYESSGLAGYLTFLLTSVDFLFRSELGQVAGEDASGAKIYALKPTELATWMAYTFTGGPPDPELIARAEEGKLETAEQTRAAAQNLLATERARTAFRRFTEGWLDTSAAVNTELPEELRQSLVEETLSFVEHVVFNENGSLRDLLLAPYSVMNKAVAQHYDMTIPDTGDRWQVVPHESGDRMGVLAHARFLASAATTSATHPVRRGLFVRKKLLCQEFPPPPVGAELRPVSDPTATTREKFEVLHNRSDCSSCHQFIDGIGFGLEGYDQRGQARTQEKVPSGEPRDVDPSGVIGSLFSPETVLSDREPPVAFSGIKELAELVSESPNAHSCFVRQVFRYTAGRRERPSDSCQLERLKSASGGEPAIQDVLLALTEAPQFRYRSEKTGADE